MAEGEEKIPSNLKGYHLERGGGMGLIKKVILLIVVILVLLYFFKRAWFDLVINFVRSFF
ncbi:MAG: hypothetical protein CMH62_03055 [Nanoarchaeota archaeon]|nr:hypothetical protein [Nanoarchaeota archaeon]